MIDRVTYQWDGRAHVEPAWYCQAFDGNVLMEDSQKVFWPVAIDRPKNEENELLADLEEAFPGAEIERLPDFR